MAETGVAPQIRVVEPDPRVEVKMTLRMSQWALLARVFATSSSDLADLINARPKRDDTEPDNKVSSGAFNDFGLDVYRTFCDAGDVVQFKLTERVR